MKRFIAEHGDFTKLQNNVTKHVHVMGELAEIIGRRSLMELSSVSGATLLCMQYTSVYSTVN